MNKFQMNENALNIIIVVPELNFFMIFEKMIMGIATCNEDAITIESPHIKSLRIVIC